MTSRRQRAAVYGRQSRGKQKSIDEQVQICTTDAAEQGWTVSATFRDRTSASRYARSDRPEWARVVEAIHARPRAFDVLVVWATSRADRTLTSWSALLDACRSSGVLIRVVDDDRTYDPRRSGDWAALAQQGINNAVDSDKISAGVRRGQAGAARAGNPSHGRCPYGYQRVYDPATGKLTGQHIDTPAAAVVREIFARLARGVPVSTIAADLELRGVPRPAGGRWHRQRIRDIATNPAYAGLRRYGRQRHPAGWPPIVDADLFATVQAVLAEPSRMHTRPGAVRHLLSYLAVCVECGAQLCAVRGRYRCDRGHVTIAQEPADTFVTRMILARLALPDLYERLQRAGQDADQAAAAARADAAALREELHGWRLDAAAGRTSPDSLAVIEEQLVRRIGDAERRAEQATVPPALRQVLEPGADVAGRWEVMTVPSRRAVVAELAQIVVGQASAPGSRLFEWRRLGASRWVGDDRTWADIWADAPHEVD